MRPVTHLDPPGYPTDPIWQAPAPLLSDPLGPPLPTKSFFQLSSPATEIISPPMERSNLTHRITYGSI